MACHVLSYYSEGIRMIGIWNRGRVSHSFLPIDFIVAECARIMVWCTTKWTKIEKRKLPRQSKTIKLYRRMRIGFCCVLAHISLRNENGLIWEFHVEWNRFISFLFILFFFWYFRETNLFVVRSPSYRHRCHHHSVINFLYFNWSLSISRKTLYLRSWKSRNAGVGCTIWLLLPISFDACSKLP